MPFGVNDAVLWYMRGMVDAISPSLEKRLPRGAAGSYITGMNAGLSALLWPIWSATWCRSVEEKVRIMKEADVAVSRDSGHCTAEQSRVQIKKRNQKEAERVPINYQHPSIWQQD